MLSNNHDVNYLYNFQEKNYFVIVCNEKSTQF